MRALVPIGRVLFALIFVLSIVGHFSPELARAASAHGVPFATILVPASGVLALVGGLSIMLGFHARIGAVLLIAFLIPVTLVMHRFWGLPDPDAAMMQRVHFLKNTSMIGACLLILYFGSGPHSIDR